MVGIIVSKFSPSLPDTKDVITCCLVRAIAHFRWHTAVSMEQRWNDDWQGKIKEIRKEEFCYCAITSIVKFTWNVWLWTWGSKVGNWLPTAWTTASHTAPPSGDNFILVFVFRCSIFMFQLMWHLLRILRKDSVIFIQAAFILLTSLASSQFFQSYILPNDTSRSTFNAISLE